MAWRALQPSDFKALIAIADIVHPGYPERFEVLEEKVSLYPKGCFVLEIAGEPLGYCLSHPWVLGHPPKLDSFLNQLPHNADCYYLHDIALLPGLQGQGWGRKALDLLIALARSEGFEHLALVSVDYALTYWRAHGFEFQENNALADKLQSYGADVHYLTRAI